METETLGLLSGIGHLPVDVAKSAKERGCRIVAIGVVPDIDPELPEVADVYYDIHIGKIGKIISALKKNNVKIVTMIGKVTKEILYKKGAIIPDMRALKILSSVPDRKDDTIMNAIVKELESPGRDPRDELPNPLLRTDVLEMKDLKEGKILKGTVRNVIDFGAFVDIGVHQDGLVHISQMTNKKFIKHPLEVVSVGDIVDVKVMSVDLKKRRIQLAMIDV